MREKMGVYCEHGTNVWEGRCGECENQEKRNLEKRIELLEDLLKQALQLAKCSKPEHIQLIKKINKELDDE
jgi:hypothetical protein